MTNRINYKFAVQILYFDCDQFILRTISNCAPFVDKIFVTYSPKPWNAYNKDARSLHKNPSNPDILKRSPYFDKVDLIEGVWDTEEDQRNHCLNIAKNQGFDYLIIQDADEFYLSKEYRKNIEGILSNPDYDYYRNPWFYFWKNLNNVIINRYYYFQGNASLVRPYEYTRKGFNACFAINCKKSVTFLDRRMVNSNKYLMLEGVCLHLSYVLSDEQLNRKLQTWGHSHQVNIDHWLTLKWYGYKKGVKNIHPISYIQWPKIVSYNDELPKELINFSVGEQIYIRPSSLLWIKNWFLEQFKKFEFALKDLKYFVKRIQ